MKRDSIYRELLKEYDSKRIAARMQLEARRNEIYEMAPRIREIDREIAQSGFEAAFSALNSSEKAKETARAYKHRCDALIKERNAILKECGIPKKYLEVQYECKVCGDTGYVGNEECRCFKLKRADRLYCSYQLKERLRSETFDSFDFRYYSGKTAEGGSISPKKNMERIVKYCLDYTKSFDTKKPNLLFYGTPGLGKTFLCNSIAGELMGRGYLVIYVTAFSLFKLINDIQFGKAGDSENSYILEDIMTADLLIIDDIGTEFSTIVTGTGFFNVINSRALSKSPVIVSTNLYPNELKELYSERIFSRIIGDYSMFEFYGEDIRTLKKYGKFLE